MPIIGAGRSGGFNSNYGGSGFYIDISQVMDTIEMMQRVMTPEKFNEMLRRTFNDAGKKVKTIMRTEIPKDYEVSAGWVGSKVGWPQPRGIGVVIPIKGTRGSVGGRFGVLGQRGRPSKKSKRAYKINAKIMKGQTSTMPAKMEHQGGQPPFMVGKVAFTRKYANKSHPIVHVVGLGVPQMPLNKSRGDVEKAIQETVEKRLQHHFTQLFG